MVFNLQPYKNVGPRFGGYVRSTGNKNGCNTGEYHPTSKIREEMNCQGLNVMTETV